MMTMADPVVTADGQTYERNAIEGWLLTRNTSPATGAVLPHKELAPNFALRKAIETWEETTQMRVPRADIDFPETRPISAGAFKTVYKGSVRILGKRITVAVLLIRESCETEVQTFLKLGRHPRLVRFLGQCNEGSNLLLLTEFAEMGSLSDAFEQLEGKLSPAHKRVISLQICQGMEHLAEMKFIHRDLAARNCLLFAFREEDVRATSVKVGDFGLTLRKQYNQTYAVGAEGEARPIRWHALEVLQYSRFSEKTDVWALGITTWEVWSEGKIPYFDVLEKDLVSHVLGGGRPSRTHIEGGCPDDIWQIITVCVDKDPKKRPRFSELLMLLGGITSPAQSRGVRQPAITESPPSPPSAPPLPRREAESDLSDIWVFPAPVPWQQQEASGPTRGRSTCYNNARRAMIVLKYVLAPLRVMRPSVPVRLFGCCSSTDVSAPCAQYAHHAFLARLHRRRLDVARLQPAIWQRTCKLLHRQVC
jgi:serine/threonine protein kinase